MKKIIVKKIFKHLFINLTVFLSTICVLLFIPALAYKSYKYFEKMSLNDQRFNLSNMKQYKWAKLHFDEFHQTKNTFSDYITWHRKPFVGETININKMGIRKSYIPMNLKNNEKYLFFGDSAMWGTGSNDENTIPSAFAKINNVNVTNFAESGHTTKQLLVRLISMYTDTKPRKNKIIFFNGAADVQIQCYSKTLNTTQLTLKIRSTLDGAKNSFSFSYLFMPWIDFITKIKKRLFSSESKDSVDCTNKVKAKKIARNIVKSWEIAQFLAHKNNDDFIAILQPIAFIGNHNLTHMNNITSESQNLSSQFKNVYTIIRKIIKDTKINFYDLSKELDTKDQIFIDSYHFSPDGNKLIAKKITQNLFYN